MRTKQNPTTKLYAKLAPEEQAALVIQALAYDDSNQVDDIVAQVIRRDYRCMNQDYLRRVESLRLIAFRYGLEFWSSRAAFFYFCVTGNAPYVDKSLIKLSSLEEAFRRVCKRMGVDGDALKKLVACDKAFGIRADALPKEVDERIVDLFVAELDACILK